MEPDLSAADRSLSARGKGRVLFGMPSFIAGSAIVLLWVGCAVAPGLFTTRTEVEAVRSDAGALLSRVGPSADAWFGTDAVANDVLARVVYGADSTVVTASLAAVAAVVVGAVTALMMGTSRGWVDEALGRAVEAVVSLPVVLFALLTFSVFGISRLASVLIVAGLFSPLVAKTVRERLVGQRKQDGFDLAAVSGLVLVEFTERLRYAVLIVATLSFLGFSADDNVQADWGRDFARAYPLIGAGLWWEAFFPALAITSLVLATNLVGHSINVVYSTPAVTPSDQAVE